MPSPAARAVEFDTRSGHRSWTVVDQDGLPIEDVEQFLGTLRATSRSENTLRAYASHLSLFWRWLASRQLNWQRLTFPELTTFLHVYRMGVYPLERRTGEGGRSEASTKAVAAAVKEFLEFQRLEGRGNSSLHLTRLGRNPGAVQHKFLAHALDANRTPRNRLLEGFRESPRPPVIIEGEAEFDRLINACHSYRDRLLLSGLYDGGLRIGQALGLRHEDLQIAERRAVVRRRLRNPNRALSKSKDEYEVKLPRRFFDYYKGYLFDELAPAGIEAEYLFVNVHQDPLGAPCSYSNIYKQVVAIADRAGLPHVTPHVLRHSHATGLARADWTSAQIAERLGQRFAASADKYIHLATNDLEKKLLETEAVLRGRE